MGVINIVRDWYTIGGGRLGGVPVDMEGGQVWEHGRVCVKEVFGKLWEKIF
jgi:hypothetical protein